MPLEEVLQELKHELEKLRVASSRLAEELSRGSPDMRRLREALSECAALASRLYDLLSRVGGPRGAVPLLDYLLLRVEELEYTLEDALSRCDDLPSCAREALDKLRYLIPLLDSWLRHRLVELAPLLRMLELAERLGLSREGLLKALQLTLAEAILNEVLACVRSLRNEAVRATGNLDVEGLAAAIEEALELLGMG